MIARSGSMLRMEVINALIKKNNYKRYLEIGVQNEVCWKEIVCDYKVGVDPDKGGTHRMTSDEFFKQNTEKFDIIFVDGLHICQQSLRDVENALLVLNVNGVIIMHDCIPSSYEAQLVPRIQKHWNGDVWRSFVELRRSRKDIEMNTIQTDCGLGIIKKGTQELLNIGFNPTYEEFEINQKEWLNAIDCETFRQLYL